MFTSWGLIWIVVAALFAAGAALNLSQRAYRELPPTDGVAWVHRDGGIYAEKVREGLSASRAGISKGDRLIAISLDGETFNEVVSIADIPMFLDAAGVGGTLSYYYQKPAYSFSNNFYYADLKNIDSLPRWNPSIIFMTFVGFVWFGVGLFVLFKQGSRSPFVLHFATVCLAAFIFHVYRPLGSGQDLDLAIQLFDDMAFAFYVPLFIHFCSRYPVHNKVFHDQRWKDLALYVPALLITLSIWGLTLGQLVPVNSVAGTLREFAASYGIFPFFNQLLLLHFVAGVTIGATILLWRFLTNKQPLVHQRLKWVLWGTMIAVIPILAIQIAKRFIYLPDDSLTVAISTLPLALIPLSFGHSVVRYRLMDVDVVVKRALVYVTSTVFIAMLIGIVALVMVLLIGLDTNLSTTEIALRALISIIAMAAIVMLGEPLKNFLQERANRFFYGERYDSRQGLLDFGRTLSATTALDPLLDGLIERLKQVLDVEKVAVFIEDERLPSGFRIARTSGLEDEFKIPPDFKLSIRQKSAATGVVRADELETLDAEVLNAETNGHGGGPVRQELHYFVPCVARSKMVAVIGLGRASDGSLLSSEDLEILKTISGYIAVAIENGRLYQEQQQQTEELALLKEFNESIVESVNVGLLAVDEEGRITRCNSTFEDLMQMPRADVVGKLVEEVFDESFALNIANILGQTRWHLTEVRNAYKLHTFDAAGGSLMLNVAIAPLRSVSNAQTGAIVVLENVTSRVKLEETLQQSEKLSSIGLLAAGVAHEVNTPLTGVSSYTQMLLGMIPETDPKHALLQKMQRQTDRASNIVGNLLNFSRTGTAMESIEVDVNKLLDDTLQLLEPQLRKSNVEIEKAYSKVPARVFGNSGKLQQVFTNLILNARDSMLSGGTITLTTAANGGNEVEITVSDTGVGIPQENLSKIFDPFFTTKGVGNGTGLGLAVTYGIVQEHGGTIEVESGDSGTTFFLAFPAIDRKRKRAVS